MRSDSGRGRSGPVPVNLQTGPVASPEQRSPSTEHKLGLSSPPLSPVTTNQAPHSLQVPHQNGYSQHHYYPAAREKRIVMLQSITLSDYTTINSVITKYSDLLTKLSLQTWQGDKQSQLLAHDLNHKIIQLQFIIEDPESSESAKITALRQLVREFNKAIHLRLEAEVKPSWFSWMFGAPKVSLEKILLDFKEQDTPLINNILMKFEKGYVGTEIIDHMTNASDLMKRLKAHNAANKIIKGDIQAFEQAANLTRSADSIKKQFTEHFSKMILSPELSAQEALTALRESHPEDKEIAECELKFRLNEALLSRLKQTYLNANAMDALEEEFQKLYQEFLKYTPPQIGLWLPISFEMSKLLRMAALVTPVGSSEREFANTIADALDRINWSRRMAVNLELAYDPEQKYFDKIIAHITSMRVKIRAVLRKTDALQPVSLQLRERLNLLYEQAVAIEQGYIVQEHKANREQVKDYIRKTKLLAIYEFCYLFRNADFSNNHDYCEAVRKLIDYSEQVYDPTRDVDSKDEVYKQFLHVKHSEQIHKLTRKLDVGKVIYKQFMNNKDFENISLITTEQRKRLKEFREQFWQGDAAWQAAAAALEAELKKFQNIIDDKHDTVLNRLAAASELVELFDVHIDLRVGKDLSLLKQHGWFTRLLQYIDLGYYLRKISIKDIFVNYREHGQAIISQGIKNIISRLSPENRRVYVYQTNFRYIYYKLGFYAKGYLHEFIKPRPESAIVKIARDLMNTLSTRSKKIKRIIHEPNANIVQCINEAESAVQDFNKAIVSFMGLYYEKELAEFKQLAERRPAGRLRTLLLNNVAGTYHEAVYGDAEKDLTSAVRAAIKNISPQPADAHEFIAVVFKKIHKLKELKIMMGLDETNFTSDQARRDFARELINIVEGIAATLTGQETVAQIVDWQRTTSQEISTQIAKWVKFYYPDPVAPEVKPENENENETLKRNKNRENLLRILNTELKKTIANISKRAKALAQIEEAAAKFTSSVNKKPFMELAYQLINEIADAAKRNEVKESLNQASADYDSANGEAELIWQFLIERTEKDTSLLDGILLHFKRDDEKLLQSWIDEIKAELQAEREANYYPQDENESKASHLSIEAEVHIPQILGMLRQSSNNQHSNSGQQYNDKQQQSNGQQGGNHDQTSSHERPPLNSQFTQLMAHPSYLAQLPAAVLPSPPDNLGSRSILSINSPERKGEKSAASNGTNSTPISFFPSQKYANSNPPTSTKTQHPDTGMLPAKRYRTENIDYQSPKLSKQTPSTTIEIFNGSPLVLSRR